MKTVLFDFDRTLLDTDALKNEQARRVALLSGHTIDQVNNAMRSYIASLQSNLDFNVDDYAEFLNELWQVNPLEILRIYLIDNEYIATYLFDDTLSTLKSLFGKVRIGILSEANPTSQLVKLEKSGVLPYIDHELLDIVRRKTAPEVLGNITTGTVIVDDDIRVINAIEEWGNGISGIWVNRKCEIHECKSAQIQTLSQVVSLL